MPREVFAVAAIGVAGLGLWLLVRAQRSGAVRARLLADDPHPLQAPESETAAPSGLALWLLRAGHRRPGAARAFVAITAGCVVVGALLPATGAGLGWAEAFAALFAGLPVVGPGVSGLVAVSPWLLAIAIAAAPALLVRRDRQRRLAEVEQQLPLTIELLATLAEAGLGFESALQEVLEAQVDSGAFSEELRIYRLQVSAGARRSDSLRALAHRVDSPAVTGFVSALIHGEETGASLSGMLRPQAGLIRQQRRERALARAEALPEKLVLPLLVGFLPGLLIWTLGPAFHQLFLMIDTALR